MNRVALALLLGLCSAAACSSPRDAAVPQVPLRFEQTPCFGPCAVFVLDVSASGDAQLTLRKPFLEGPLAPLNAGTYRATVSDALRATVVQTAEQVRFESLDARYDNPRVMDLPSTKYTIGSHTVEQRYGGPDLSALKASFYAILETTVWESISASSTLEH